MRINKYKYMEEAGADGAAEGGAATPAATPAVALSSENWRDFVSEDLRGNDSLSKFTSLDGLAKSYLNAESMIPKDKMVIPTTDDEWQDTFGKLGRPDTADDYKIDYGKGNDGSNELSVGFREAAYIAGLSQTQVEQIFNWYGEATEKATQDNDSKFESDKTNAEESLKKEWGEKFDANVELAKRVIGEFGDEDFSEFLENSGLGNNPSMVKFLHSIGSVSGEDNFEQGDSSQAQSPDQIREEINIVMASPAYTNKIDPSHDGAVKKAQDLFNRLHAAA